MRTRSGSTPGAHRSQRLRPAHDSANRRGEDRDVELRAVILLHPSCQRALDTHGVRSSCRYDGDKVVWDREPSRLLKGTRCAIGTRENGTHGDRVVDQTCGRGSLPLRASSHSPVRLRRLQRLSRTSFRRGNSCQGWSRTTGSWHGPCVTIAFPALPSPWCGTGASSMRAVSEWRTGYARFPFNRIRSSVSRASPNPFLITYEAQLPAAGPR